MAQHVCPWWIGYFLASPIRRISFDPRKILAPFVSEGMTVLEPGPGMGFFTLELARAVGPKGRVVAVDVQAKMLAALERRARRAGLSGRIECRLVRGDGLGVGDLAGKVDLVIAFAMVHEVPDTGRFFQEAAAALKRGGHLFFVEPAGHVTKKSFETSLRSAAVAGLHLESLPAIHKSHAALVRKE